MSSLKKSKPCRSIYSYMNKGKSLFIPPPPKSNSIRVSSVDSLRVYFKNFTHKEKYTSIKYIAF